jgi:hypothetical protein
MPNKSANKALAISATVLCVLAFAASLAFAMGAVFALAGLGSGGASEFQKSAGSVLATLGVSAPAVPVAALVVVWVAYSREQRRLITWAALLPWIYMVMVGGLFFLLPSL